MTDLSSRIPWAVLALSMLGCSDPVYYPEMLQAWGVPDTGAEDTAAPVETFGLDLTGVPCPPEALGPRWVWAADNQHAGVVNVYQRGPDCGLVHLGELAGGPTQALSPEGEVFVFSDEGTTQVLAWLQVLANDAASVVVP